MLCESYVKMFKQYLGNIIAKRFNLNVGKNPNKKKTAKQFIVTKNTDHMPHIK